MLDADSAGPTGAAIPSCNGIPERDALISPILVEYPWRSALSGPVFTDYYELLQLSPNADFRTIEQVFRSLARQYHPDNPTTGDSDFFRSVIEAFETLSDPEKRAQYDIEHSRRADGAWRILETPAEATSLASDNRIQHSLLEILYRARRFGELTLGVGIMELERLTGAPEAHLRFHLWYLKEKGWIERLDSGEMALTAYGVDEYVSRRAGHRERRLLEDPRTAAEAQESLTD
jgi:hypothetical protein